MHLNLHILYMELLTYDPTKSIHHDLLVQPLAFPTLYNGEIRPLGDRLYIVSANQLPPHMDISDSPNFICVGKPADFYLAAPCNMIWLERDLSLPSLFTLVSEAFYRYQSWYSSMQEVINQNLPLRTLGELSQPIFDNPIKLFDVNYMSFFHIFNETIDQLPDKYRTYGDYSYMPIEEIALFQHNPKFKEALSAREPYLYLGPAGNTSLCYNIFIGEKYSASVVIDEISRKFSDRDYVLITILGQSIYNALRYKGTVNFSVPRSTDEMIRQILDQKTIVDDDLASALKSVEWELQDFFYCMILVPTDQDISDKLLSIIAEQLCDLHKGSIYIVFNRSILLITNLQASSEIQKAVFFDKNDRSSLRSLQECIQTRESILAIIKNRLNELPFQAGVSTLFSGFDKLYYYYKLAGIALLIGQEQNAGQTIYCYEDYALKNVIKRCKYNTLPETLCPTSLLKLLHYDKEKGTDFCHILKVYLECNMNIAETKRKLYMHRNTLLYRLSRINELLEMDLENHETRLHLMLAFKALEDSVMADSV